MKKFILSALMALTCGALFAADTDMYLFWMIGNAESIGGQTASALVSQGGYTARLSVSGSDGTYLNLYSDELVPLSGNPTVSLGDVVNWDTAAAVGGYEASSFFVEILNSGEVAFKSETKSYADLTAYLSSMKDMAQPGDTYAFGGFTAVPEPTSGLLLLLGVAGLALRRKKMQKA